MSAVAVRNVSKLWGSVRAVDDVSFTAEPGTLSVLLGPSGCGKSTTLRLIAGLETADSGSIHIGGRDVTKELPSRRNISMVFQSYALFPHLSVAENIVFGLRVRGVGAEELDRRLKHVGDMLGLTPLLSRRPSQLSGGQQQRVALGRAVIAEAPVCLMDEPLSNLDAQLRAEMREEIRNLQQKLGITMLYVTHDQIEAMSMADRVILLRGGRIEQDGPPDVLYSEPASVFTARFIGTPPMNVVDLVRGSGGWVLPGTAAPVLFTGESPVALGIRPEDIRVSLHGSWEARVQRVEYLGADSVVGCTIGGASIIARLPGKVPFRAGEAVRLEWAAGAQHLFDAQSGIRLVTEPVSPAGTFYA